MKPMRSPIIVAKLAIILGDTALSSAQQNAQGAVELSNGTKVPQNPSLPKPQSLPTAVLSQMPELRDYMYMKMKNQVLIVNGMTNKIVDLLGDVAAFLTEIGADLCGPRFLRSTTAITA